MANLTLAPNPWFTGFDDDGDIVPGGLLFTYAAGSSTKKNTYTDVAGAVANTNPIVLDAAGRVPSGLFLLPSSYKFVLAPANDTDPPANPIRTQDNIGAVPTTDIDNDVTGTAGEAMTAGEGAYLSDGSGGLIAGRWYLFDSDNTYSSTTPEVSFVVSDVAAAATGTFRLSGRETNQSGLTPGANYYVSATPGAITTTAPANARFVGQADSITSLIVSPNPPLVAVATVVDPKIKDICDGRLTLTSGTPVTTADVTAATTLYWALYKGNQISLYNGTRWQHFTVAQLSIAVPAVATQMYDVFVDYNAGTPALSLTAWTNDTTRATALTTQDGVLVLTGTLGKRYVGSVRTVASGQLNDSAALRHVWNYYHRVARLCRVLEATDSWSYSTSTRRQANGSTANQLAVVIGVAEVMVNAHVAVTAVASADLAAYVSIGRDSTTTPHTGCTGIQQTILTANFTRLTADLLDYPPVGYHIYTWLELGPGAGTVTWYGDNGGASNLQSGIYGSVEG
jgi:hypothetical protein